jgi:hypothetical protein
MGLGGSGADDKKIGERRDSPEIENDNILGLFIFSQLDAKPC